METLTENNSNASSIDQTIPEQKVFLFIFVEKGSNLLKFLEID